MGASSQSSGDYTHQIDTALGQANQPKSQLSQAMSGNFLNNFGSVLSQLGNSGGMGNAFPGYQYHPNPGISTPGSIQNQTPPPNNAGVPTSNIHPPVTSAYNPNLPQLGMTDNSNNYTGPVGPPSGMMMPSDRVDSSGQIAQDQTQSPINPDVNRQALQVQGLQGIQNQNQNNPQLGQFSGVPNIQQANPNLQSMNMQGMDQGALSTLMQQIQGMNAGTYNPAQSNLGSVSQALQGLLGNSGNLPNIQQANPGNTQAVNAQATQANLAPIQQQYNSANDPYYQAVQQSLQQQQGLDQKNLQAQFGASGGMGMGTPAAFAQAQLMAQQSPQMAAALGNVAQQDQANQLQRAGLIQSGALQNAQMANNANLQNSQLGTNVNLQNISNQLQAANQNNQANLGQGGLGNQNLSTISGLLSSLTGQAGNQNLGQSQLNSQNQLQAAGLNSQNANNALQNQLGFQTNQNSASNGLNSLLASLGQFNAGQINSGNQGYAQMMQTANQNQINNQFTGNQNLAQIMAQFGLAGIPGGSANVSLGGQSQTLLQQLLGAL